MNYKGTKDKKFTCKNCSVEFSFKGYSSNNIFCSIECSVLLQRANKEQLNEQRYNDWLIGKDLGVKNPRPLIRDFVIRRDGYQCSVCSNDTWNDKPITLWTDHIDGNAANNQPDNFRLVCPNCDSQSATFGGKNYGNGRKSRGMSQYG
jgi:5-methylcytosine-specific restriction endonuclease McrA